MASTKSNPSPSYYPQEFYARIRYSNALPPPPCPPKFLEIPGLESIEDRYTSVAYAARLAREQPLCMEVDSELGMPLDLVGIPGVFEDDWSALEMSADAKSYHHTDTLLLRPLQGLSGKAEVRTANAAFLRRGEHLQQVAAQAAKARIVPEPRCSPDLPAPDAMTDVRIKCMQGWTSTYPDSEIMTIMRQKQLLAADAADHESLLNPRHPSKPRARLFSSYQVIPNLSAITDTGGYYSLQVEKQSTETHVPGESLNDDAIVRPVELPESAKLPYIAKVRAHEADSLSNPAPGPEPLHYEWYQSQPPATQKARLRLRQSRTSTDAGLSADITSNKHMQSYSRAARYETDVGASREANNQDITEISIVLVDSHVPVEVGKSSGMNSGCAQWSNLLQHIGLRGIHDPTELKKARDRDDEAGPNRLDITFRDADTQELKLRNQALLEMEKGS